MNKEKKENRVMSFRFDDHILKKIDYLKDEENRKIAGFGIKPKTRKTIIETIIEDYYLRYINKSTDPDVVGRVSRMVDDAADSRFARIENRIDEILYLTIKNDLGNKLLYRSPSVLPVPDTTANALYVIANEHSKWDLALEEYMNSSEIKKRLAADNIPDNHYRDDEKDQANKEATSDKESICEYQMRIRRG